MFGNLILIPGNAKEDNERLFEVGNAYVFLGFKGTYDALPEFLERIDASRCALVVRWEGERHVDRRKTKKYILHLLTVSKGSDYRSGHGKRRDDPNPAMEEHHTIFANIFSESDGSPAGYKPWR